MNSDASPNSAARARNFDPVADNYDASRFLPPEVQAQAAALIRDAANLAPGQVLLDAGAGTGRFALPLAQMGVPVVGVDISERMLSRLRIKRRESEQTGSAPPLRIARADLRALPLASDSCGAVLTVHILHLIEEWQRVLAEIRRVLAPGGVFLLASESGLRAPARERYVTLARERGLWGPRRDTADSETLRAFLAGQGAVLAEAGEGIRWKARAKLTDTLIHLERRIWSSCWDLPDAPHAELIAATRAWAIQTYGSLDVEEEAEMAFHVWTARW